MERPLIPGSEIAYTKHSIDQFGYRAPSELIEHINYVKQSTFISWSRLIGFGSLADTSKSLSKSYYPDHPKNYAFDVRGQVPF